MRNKLFENILERVTPKTKQKVSDYADNGSRLCEGKGLEALNFKISTND